MESIYYAGAFFRICRVESGKNYTREELVELCEYLTERVNETAPELPEGAMRRTRLIDIRKTAVSGVRKSVAAMQAAGEQYPVLGGYYPRPKEVAVSWILSVQQLCGVYSPFTIEANLQW